MKREKKERVAILKDNQKKIAEYKSKVSTLKKFKHVLDFRLREVSESLQPKERQIANLKQQLMDLEGEFEEQVTQQRDMEYALHSKKQKIQQQSAEMKKYIEAKESSEAVVKKFTNSLYEMVEGCEIKQWPDRVKVMYQEFVTDAGRTPAAAVKNPAMLEMHRQMRLMDKKMRTLTLKVNLKCSCFFCRKPSNSS